MLDVLDSQCEIIGVIRIIKLIRNFQANENMAWDIFKKPDRVDWVQGLSIVYLMERLGHSIFQVLENKRKNTLFGS